MKLKVILISASMIGTALFSSIWKNPPFDIRLFSNNMFALSLLVSMTGAGLFLYQTDFLHSTIRVFRQLLRLQDKSRQIADEVEQKKSSSSLKQLQFPLTRPLLFTGLLWLIITSLVSITL